MAKIHDWSRVYWRNASGDREFFLADDLNEDNVPDEVRAMYRNDHGDEVAYRLADEEAEHGLKYEVTFNGEVIRDVTIDAWEGDEDREPEVELAAFGTRADARKFASEWRKAYGSPEDLGYVEYDEDELLNEMDYDEVVEIAQDLGIRADQSHEDLAAQIAGEEEPKLTSEAREVAQ